MGGGPGGAVGLDGVPVDCAGIGSAVEMPSNRGMGAAMSFVSYSRGLEVNYLTLRCDLSRGCPPCLRMSNQS
jgi:hypothetical protein